MKNIFGTDGIRGHVGVFPFDQETIQKIGYALLQWAAQKHSPKAKIIIGHDTRESCTWILSSLLVHLLRSEFHIYNAGTLPTPAICHLMQKLDYDVGLIISASHNPYTDNGIKVIDRHGKITQEDEEHLSYLISVPSTSDYFHFASYHTLSRASHIYTQSLISYFPSNFLKNKKIVLDCAHGATSRVAPLIFKKLGATTVSLHTKPNGKNINDKCGALHVHHLQEKVIKHNADIGFAFDGDGDRVICVNRNGHIKNGDDILALLSQHPLYQGQHTIVSTTMANHAFDTYLQQKGKSLIRTAVGDKYVAEYLTAHNLLLGGEQSGHIILHDYLPTGDGIFTALRICQTLITLDNWDFTTFIPYPQILLNVAILEKKDLKNESVAIIIKKYEKLLNGGRLIVRYSGTEPILRIMVEDEKIENAQYIAHNLASQLQEILR